MAVPFADHAQTERIRYYGLHGNVRYEKVRQQLTRIVPTGTAPDLPTAADPRGYRVVPRKTFA